MEFYDYIQIAIFAVLFGLSLLSCLKTIRGRLSPLRFEDYEFPRDKIAKRLIRVFTEVFLQYKVIRDRPLVGLMHAFVMWGFMAFLWVTLEHFYMGFTGLKNTSENNSLYGAFAAAWSILVLVGISGLTYRRFITRPKELGKLSPTSGLISALIILLMATYLLDWHFLQAGTVSWKINWWLHTICLLAMMIMIPRSKHLHLVLAPLAIYLRAETTSPLKPLDLDKEELGLIKFSQLDFKDIVDLNACVECGRCTAACPVNAVGGSLSPKNLILQMQKGFKAGDDVIAGPKEEVSTGKARVSEEDLFQCLSCSACEEACPVGIEHVGKKFLDLRRGLVSEGRITNKKVSDLFIRMERNPQNPWEIPGSTREKFIEKEGFPIFNGTQEWLFWLGCGNSYDDHGQKVAASMAKILNTAGISWGVLRSETCCGEPARRTGNELLFLNLSEKLIESLSDNKVKKIVTCCPHCTTMLDKDYRQMPSYQELGIEIWHHSELIFSLLDKLNLTKTEKTATFHDSCYLARGRKITAEPREILKSCGITIEEMAHSKENTSCCGAGGGQIFIADDRKDIGRVNHKRFEEVMDTKASTVAVACPYCPMMLRDAANHKKVEIDILDIAEIVAERLK